MTREEHVQHPGDEAVFIPANGSSLAATITKPTGVQRAPAVILAAGPGTPGRDRVLHGVPVYGQVAGALAAAGYFVVRYDARGTGQSGGRFESASLLSYRDDVLNVIQWLRRRQDVDGDRMAVVGFGDSGPIALLAAEREGRIKGVALMAAAGRPGREVVLDEQQRALARLGVPEAERTDRIALQTRLNEATVTGRGWETLPSDLRERADTQWFRSWLLFDPARTLEDVRQPVLILHGALDTETPPEHADRLQQLSETSRRVPPTHTRKVIVSGANHFFVSATTGRVDEYATLSSRTLAPEVGDALIGWLKSVVFVR
jgi:hypothetical protein